MTMDKILLMAMGISMWWGIGGYVMMIMGIMGKNNLKGWMKLILGMAGWIIWGMEYCGKLERS